MGGYKNPRQALDLVRTIGRARAEQTFDQVLVLSFASGAYIAFGAYCALLVGGNVPGIKHDNPGVQKLLYGAAFTVGLMMTTLTGSDLYTGNVFTLSFSLYSKKTRISNILHVIKSILITFFGNFAGAVFVGYLFVYLLASEPYEPWVAYLKTAAEMKTTKNVGLLFLSSIACNWIVSTAVFMIYTAEDVGSKIAAMFFPIAAFAIYGYEHVIANCFFLPTAAMFGANVPVWRMFFWNLLPVAVGNYIGGAIFVGVTFWYGHMFRPKHKNTLWNLATSCIRREKDVESPTKEPHTPTDQGTTTTTCTTSEHSDDFVAIQIELSP